MDKMLLTTTKTDGFLCAHQAHHHRRFSLPRLHFANLFHSGEESSHQQDQQDHPDNPSMAARQLATSASYAFHKMSLTPIYESYCSKLEHAFKSEHSSPFRRWTATGGGGAGERALSHRSYRRPSSLLAAVSDHDMYAKCDGVTGAGNGGVAAWSLGLERLLADPSGASAFAAFLTKEFSAENIRFWSACEQYACSGGDAAAARDIYARHLADGAPEPVNVDAPARAAARERLCDAPADLFAQAQKQVFNLMKFDSYPRFLRSPVHAECARAELCGAPSPYAPPSTAGTQTPTKLKKSFSNAEERRRGIIPWARLRGGSKDRGQPQATQPEENGKPQVQTTNNVSPSQSLSLDGPPSRCTLCRVELPDAATTVVALGTGQTVRQLVDRLLEKRGMQCSAYDVFELGCSKPMDVAQSASNLAGKQVRVERRVVFRLELPNRRVVSVRCRPSKPLGAVLRPVLQRYGAAGAGAAAALGVALGGQTLDLGCAVQVADGQRLQVTLNEELAAKFAQQNCSQSTNGNAETGHGQPSIPGETSSSEAVKLKPNLALPSLDEITNRVFEEVLQGKAELQIDKEEGSIKSSNCSSSHSSGIFGHLMRRGCSVPSGTCSVSTEGGTGVPLVAKLRAGVRLQSAGGNVRSGDNAEFLESLRQAQKARLKDKIDTNQTATQLKLATIHADSHQTDDAKMQQSMVPPVPAIRNLTNVSSKPAPAVRTILTSKPTCNGENSNAQDVNVKAPLSFVSSSYAMTKNLIPNNNAECNGSIGDDKTQSVCTKLTNNHFETDNNNVNILNGNEKACEETTVNNINSKLSEDFGSVAKRIIDPPPLPPKPKILPTKPSNWGHNLGEPPCVQEVSLPSVNEINTRSKRMIYLDQPTSSFV